MKYALPLLACLFAPAACSRDTTIYPSLGVRPVEKLSFAEPEVKAAVAVPDPMLDAAMATFETRLATITAGFSRDAARSESGARAARGRAVGSDAWLDAQTSLAGLDDWRAQTSALVTDIEARATDRAASLKADYPGLAALRDKAQAEADRQGATIARIQTILPAG